MPQPTASQVSLILHFDEALGVTTPTDSSDNALTVTVTGAPEIKDDKYKFGRSMWFDGTNDYININNSTLFNTGNGDFTMELWFNTPGNAGNQSLFGFTSSADTVSYLAFTPENKLEWRDAEYVKFRTVALAVDTWHHVALVRYGSYIQLYVNGVSQGHAQNYYVNVTGLNIGEASEAGVYGTYEGYIDEVRFCEQVAVYRDNFTPPEGPHSILSTTIASTISETLDLTDFEVLAANVRTGIIVATDFVDTSSSTSYSVDSPDEAVNLLCVPKVNYGWQTDETYADNTLICAATPGDDPHIWDCTTNGGIAGSTEPTWAYTGNTTDNGITWAYVAELVNPVATGVKVGT